MRALWRSLIGALGRGVRPRQRLVALKLAAQRFGSERSRELLLSCLSPAQRAEFERSLGFTVRGQSGRCYRIAYGTAANIEVLGGRGEPEYRLCAAPDHLPTLAVMLSQKLMLESRETEFLRIAARHPRPAQDGQR